MTPTHTATDFLTSALSICLAAMENEARPPASADGVQDLLVVLKKTIRDLMALARRIWGDAAVDAWHQEIIMAVTQEALQRADQLIDDMDLSRYGSVVQLVLRRSLHKTAAQRIPGIVADALTNF
jgi:hypothetical protein